MLNRIDLLQDKLHEQERKVANLTKLVELNSHLEGGTSHQRKQEMDKIEFLVDKKLAEVLKAYVDKKHLDSRFYELELKIKGLSTVAQLQTSSQQRVDHESLDDVKTFCRKEIALSEQSLKSEVNFHLEEVDVKVSALRKSLDHRLQD